MQTNGKPHARSPRALVKGCDPNVAMMGFAALLAWAMVFAVCAAVRGCM